MYCSKFYDEVCEYWCFHISVYDIVNIFYIKVIIWTTYLRDCYLVLRNCTVWLFYANICKSFAIHELCIQHEIGLPVLLPLFCEDYKYWLYSEKHYRLHYCITFNSIMQCETSMQLMKYGNCQNLSQECCQKQQWR